MEPGPRTLEFYVTESGKAPFALWVDSLRDKHARATIHRRLARVRLGLLGDYKSVGDGVYEFRIDTGPGYRVYFAFAGRAVILLLCGGEKHSQAADIEKAKSYWRDYQERSP
ncbi:MAG: type II toxin-antitoxin system RelE/ParE family toxin [Nitrospirota bacterium]